MTAAVLHAPGELKFGEVELDETLGPKETIIKVMASGICGSDIGRVLTTGTYSFPTIPGHEFSGKVFAVGDAVDNVAPGQHVAVAPLLPCGECESCESGNYSLCDDYSFLGSRTDGGFAQYVKVPSRNLVPIPDDLEFPEAATIEPAAIILHGIHKIDFKAGSPALIVGVGALGYFAVQFAKLSGAHPVIAVDIDSKKLDLAAAVGADYCINGSEVDALAEILMITDGRGVDVVLETAGNNISRSLCVNAAKKQGVVVIYGSAHSKVEFEPAVFEKVLRHELSLIGSWNSYSVPFPGKEWFQIVKFIKAGKLKMQPLISHEFELNQAPRVFGQIGSKTLVDAHKVIFKPNVD